MTDHDRRLAELEAQVLALAGDVELLRRALAATCELHARESSQARMDHLTGCMTRAKFTEITSLTRGPFAVVMVDADHFKAINDTDGHQRGDYVLGRIGEILRENCRGDDIVARYGGEEFIVLLRLADTDKAQEWAERLRRSLQTEAIAHPGGVVTISCGVAATTGGEDVFAVAHRADAALYRAKEGGRNQVAA